MIYVNPGSWHVSFYKSSWFPEDALLLAVLRHPCWQWISRGVCGCSLQCRQQMPPKYPAGSGRSSFWTRQYYIFPRAMAAMTMAMSSDPASNSLLGQKLPASQKMASGVWWGGGWSGPRSAEDSAHFRKCQWLTDNHWPLILFPIRISTWDSVFIRTSLRKNMYWLRLFKSTHVSRASMMSSYVIPIWLNMR